MNTFDFFFGLNLGQRLFSHTDNLSRTLQQTKMSALSGKRVACLTKDVLQKMRNDTSFRSFYDVVLLTSKSYPSMSGPNRCYQGELARQANWHWRANISCDRTSMPPPPPPRPPKKIFLHALFFSPPTRNLAARSLIYGRVDQPSHRRDKKKGLELR